MPAALTIVLVLVSGSASSEGARTDALTPAIVEATRRALGPETRIVVKTEESMPDDAEAIRLGAEAHADAVVEVAWSEPEHLHSTIRIQRPNATRWFERDVGFRAIDDPVERSRTVALTIVSMLPEYENRLAAAAPPERASATPTTPDARKGEPAPKRKRATESKPETKSNEAEEGDGADVGEEASPSRPARRDERPVHHRTTLAAYGAAGLGAGDGEASAGAGIDFRQTLESFIAVRVGASARFGLESPGNVSARHYASALGLAFATVSSNDGRAALGFRMDGLLTLEDFAESRPGTTAHLHKLMPGADALVEASYYFVRGAAVSLGAGGEALFGRTEIFSGGRRVATLKPVRPVLELGIRFGF